MKTSGLDSASLDFQLKANLFLKDFCEIFTIFTICTKTTSLRKIILNFQECTGGTIDR